MEYIYQAKLEADPDGGFIVTFPDVPEAITSGEDKEEALLNAQDALGLALRCYAMLERPLPKASHKGGIPVNADGWGARKLRRGAFLTLIIQPKCRRWSRLCAFWACRLSSLLGLSPPVNRRRD